MSDLHPATLLTNPLEGASWERLENAWQSWRPAAAPPRWADCLPAPDRPCDPERIFFLLQLDVEYRIKAGLSALLAEPYFQHPRLQHPDARLTDAQQVELIRWEYQLRWQSGQRARRADYLAAFPQHAGALADLRPRWHCPRCRAVAFTAEDEAVQSLHCSACGTDFPLTEIFQPRTAVQAPALPDGLDLRDYELFDRLGGGGMGEVYRGRDPSLGRDLAVKVVRPCFRGDTQIERRFLREARVTGSLQHPDIVPVHNLGRLPDGRLYYTMKLVRGHTLEELLAGGTARPPEKVSSLLGIFEKVCQAVAYAHSKRVIHRDLKPGNVMVGRFGEVQVMDWGLAKVLSPHAGPPEENEEVIRTEQPAEAMEPPGLDADTESPAASTHLSRAGMALGTPAFMPPEQAEGQVALVDERADVFALGAILCVLLTGRPPYASRDGMEVLLQAQRGELAEARGRLDSCGADAELVALCQECLAPQREGRPHNAGVVAERLAAYRTGVQERLRQAELERAQAEVQAREERKRRRLAVALAAVVLLLVGAGVVGFWWRQRLQTAADQAVDQALVKAHLLFEQAQANVWEPGKYRAAVEEARKASDLAHVGGASLPMCRQADHLVARLEEEERAGEKDHRLQTQLLDVHGPREGPGYLRDDKGQMVALAQPGADEQFARAFRDWGLDVDATPTTEAAARLKGRPAGVVTEVVAALDDWVGERQRRGAGLERRQRLVDLAKELEEDPGSKRQQLRQILARGRLPLQRGLSILAATLRIGPSLALRAGVVPLPLLVPVGEDHIRLDRLAAQTDPATEPVLGLLTLARALQLSGDEARAVQLLRTALQARPREVVLYHALGQLLSQQRSPRWQEVVTCYTAARVLRPDLGVALAEALVQSGRDREGLDLLARLAVEKADNPFVHFRRGYVLAEKGDPKGALAAFNAALNLAPTDGLAHYNRGVALKALGKVEEATEAYRQTIRLSPGLAHAHNNLAVSLHGMGKVDEAITEYRRAIALDARLAQAHHNLGAALHSQGKTEDAVRELREAIRLDPDLVQAHYVLGNALRDKGEVDEAIREYRRAITLAPGDALARFHLAFALGRTGKVDEAIREYRQSIALDDRNAMAHYNLGIVLKFKGELDEAITEYGRAIALDNKHPLAHFSLGVALNTRGDVEEASASFGRAVALTPRDARAHGFLGETLLGQGRCAEAKKSLVEALKLLPEGHPLRPAVAEVLQQCDRLLELETKLSAILAGREVPADPQDIFLLARMCQQRTKRHAAARLYTDAFAADASLAEDLQKGHRYGAAGNAVRAAAGEGEDARMLPDKDVVALRRQALEWLRNDLEASAKLLGQKDSAGKRLVQRRLIRWQSDPDLVTVRDEKALGQLPEAERAAWRKLWRDVAELREQADRKPR